ALDGAVPQGRPQGGALPAAAPRGLRGRRDPGASVRFRDAGGSAGDRRRRNAARARPARTARAPGRRGFRGRAARPDRNHRGVDMTQIGFVGLGKMGGGMVHRIRRDSDHEVVAFDFDEKAVRQAVKYGAGGAGSLRELVKKLEPPRMVWIMVPAGAPTQETVDKLAKLLDRGDAIIDGGNSRWTD